MKRILVGLIALSSLLFLNTNTVSAVSVLDYPVGAAANGIGNTRHNLGAFGKIIHTVSALGPFPIAFTTEVCVFCHTPHHTNTSLAPAPLWNRVNKDSLGNAVTYTAYGTTLGGNNVSQVGSVSLACLSCHDGVTTFDTLVNAPGKDGVNPAGVDQGWWFAMPDGGGSFSSPLDHFGDAACAGCHNHYPGEYNQVVTRLNIGTDVRNDHPVSITYDDTVASLRPKSTVISSIDLTTGLASSALTYNSGNLTRNYWAVKGYISNTATIQDVLKNDKVECSSCHDPHFKNLSWDEVEPKSYQYWCSYSENCTDGQFLRRVGGNTGSGVCRTCHNK